MQMIYKNTAPKWQLRIAVAHVVHHHYHKEFGAAHRKLHIFNRLINGLANKWKCFMTKHLNKAARERNWKCVEARRRTMPIFYFFFFRFLFFACRKFYLHFISASLFHTSCIYLKVICVRLLASININKRHLRQK